MGHLGKCAFQFSDQWPQILRSGILSFEVIQISWNGERVGGWNIYFGGFYEYTCRNRKGRYTIRIQYLLSVQLNVAFQPTRLKFLLSFRRSLRLETKRGRQLDFDDETKGRGAGGGWCNGTQMSEVGWTWYLHNRQILFRFSILSPSPISPLPLPPPIYEK